MRDLDKDALVRGLKAHAPSDVALSTCAPNGDPVEVPLHFEGAMLVVGVKHVDDDAAFGTLMMQVGSDDAMVTLVASIMNTLCERAEVSPPAALSSVLLRMMVLTDSDAVTVPSEALVQDGNAAQRAADAHTMARKFGKAPVNA